MRDPFRLDGRTVVVTGASRGIGASAARAISAAGGRVVLVARSEEPLARLAGELGPGTACVAGDVADARTASAAIAAADRLGGLWGLVNNAGASPHHRPVTETPAADWESVLRVNVLGAAAFARAVGARLAEIGDGGRIVNLGSIAAHRSRPNLAPYNASKAALEALTRTLAVELGPAGILCNALAPGTIATEMVDAVVARDPALAERAASAAPLGRLGQPREVALAIVFLLSDAASFVTGQTVVVDGGVLAAR